MFTALIDFQNKGAILAAEVSINLDQLIILSQSMIDDYHVSVQKTHLNSWSSVVHNLTQTVLVVQCTAVSLIHIYNIYNTAAAGAFSPLQ